MPDLIIPSTVIGSWSFPGWFEKFAADVKEHPELFGPADRDEAVRDAVRLAIDDQLRAGLDRITDGEMQRVDFNLGFYQYLRGIEPLPRAGSGGRRPTISATGTGPSARSRLPMGWAPSPSFAGCAKYTSAPIKMPVPGSVHTLGLHRLRSGLLWPQSRRHGAGSHRQCRAQGPGRRGG